MSNELIKEMSDEFLLKNCNYIAKNHCTTLEASYIHELIERYYRKLKCTSGTFKDENGNPILSLKDLEFEGEGFKAFYTMPKSRTGAPGSVYIEGIHQEHKKDQNAWLRKAVVRFIILVIVGLVFLWQAFPIIFAKEQIESSESLFWIGLCFAAVMFEFVNFCNKSTNG